MIFELTHWMALVPLGACVLWRPADTAAHVLDPDLVGYVYPVSQAGLCYAVLLPLRKAGWAFGAVVALTALCLLLGVADVWPRFLAWGLVAGLAWERTRGLLQGSLMTYYGAGLLAWVGYAVVPGWGTWGLYQTCRALGLGAFTAETWRRR